MKNKAVKSQEAKEKFSYHVFSTEIGPCLLGWGDKGMIGLQLPEKNQRLLVEKFVAQRPHLSHLRSVKTPPKIWQRVEELIQEHLEGRSHDFLDVLLDNRQVSNFAWQVYQKLRLLPTGQMITYGQLALQMGYSASSARAIGSAMRRNPFPLIIPCHRVVRAEGGIGNYSCFNGPKVKAWLLWREGARDHY